MYVFFYDYILWPKGANIVFSPVSLQNKMVTPLVALCSTRRALCTTFKNFYGIGVDAHV